MDTFLPFDFMSTLDIPHTSSAADVVIKSDAAVDTLPDGDGDLDVLADFERRSGPGGNYFCVIA
ncbi:hypothetical protein HGRIS_007131 [Hohenbuehelia grisea]|uniref:Pheromone n=1 Tax=Hohenbuehelia grisea TaxID=104357 RepID=A0ABR3JCA6_9AGAR